MGHSLGRRNLLEINNLAVFQKMQMRLRDHSILLKPLQALIFFFLVCTT